MSHFNCAGRIVNHIHVIAGIDCTTIYPSNHTNLRDLAAINQQWSISIAGIAVQELEDCYGAKGLDLTLFGGVGGRTKGIRGGESTFLGG